MYTYIYIYIYMYVHWGHKVVMLTVTYSNVQN